MLQKIDGVLNEKKVQLLQGVHWTQRFMDAVESRPFLTDLGAIQSQHCQALNDPKIPATHRVQVQAVTTFCNDPMTFCRIYTKEM